MRTHPHLFEANAHILLRRLSERRGRGLTLGTIPEEEWQQLARQGFDLLWLMGVWRRSPGSRRVALGHAGLRREYSAVLSDWREEDVGGSPYAICSYTLDPALGGHHELLELRSMLNHLGLGLILDFVPNHLSLDHPWTDEHPGRFVVGTADDVQAHPDWFFNTGRSVHIAHGRDPNFPSWTDTAQINFFSADAREGMIGELLNISRVSDGVRCDMAMLGLNDVFEAVWGALVGDPVPREEFWTEAIGRVRESRPEFLFLAEAYWGLERRLIDLGFDFVYEKHFYDALRKLKADSVRQHMRENVPGGAGALHFIENHDEPRAAEAFGREAALAAAVVLSASPGARLFHDGQSEGRRMRLPVQLLREPTEPTDRGTVTFYDRLLRACNATVFHEGEWRMLETFEAWEGNTSYRSLLAWSWILGNELRAVAVNYSPAPAQGRLRITRPKTEGGSVTLEDELTGEVYLRSTDELRSPGLYVELGPWRSHILKIPA